MTHYPETCPSYSAPDPGGHDAWPDYESLAQHRSEMAAYGDSWPGAQVQLNRARRQLVALEAEYERRQQLLRKLPTIPSHDNDNEPF